MKCLHSVLVLVLVLAPAAARANPLDAFGFGARSVGLGGAVTAIAHDVSANYYNPAGLARGGEMRIELGYARVEPNLELSGGELDVDASRGFQGGVILAGDLYEHDVGFSVGLHLPDRRITRVRALPQSQPRFALFDNRPQRLVVSTGLGVEVRDDLYFGGTLTFMSETRGTLDIEGRVSASDAERTAVFSQVDVNLGALRYPTFGVAWTPGPWRFGLTWREEFVLDLDLIVDVHGQVVIGPTDQVVVEEGRLKLRSVNANLFSPRQLALGAAYETDRWTIALDLTWAQWSRYPPPTATIDVDVQLEPLQFEFPVPDDPTDPGFRNILIPRLGVEHRLHDGAHLALALRAGYVYEPSPAPDQPGATNYIDSDKHAVTFGLGIALRDLTEILPKPIELDLAVVAIRLDERTYEKRDPADPVGDYVARGHILGATATAGFRF